MIPQGTTPTHIFELPFSANLLKTVRVIYKQEDKELVIKTGDDVVMHDNVVEVTLTQEDTFKFDCENPVKIQVRGVTLGGEPLTSYIRTTHVFPCLEKEVIS